MFSAVIINFILSSNPSIRFSRPRSSPICDMRLDGEPMSTLSTPRESSDMWFFLAFRIAIPLRSCSSTSIFSRVGALSNSQLCRHAIFVDHSLVFFIYWYNMIANTSTKMKGLVPTRFVVISSSPRPTTDGLLTCVRFSFSLSAYFSLRSSDINFVNLT